MESPRGRITVIGAGFVGVVTAVGLATFHDVELVEVEPERTAALLAGRLPFFEPGLAERFATAREHGMSVAAGRDRRATEAGGANGRARADAGADVRGSAGASA